MINFIFPFVRVHQMLSERPITQHGLSGLSTAQARQGTATGMRQIKDKRYWQSQLQLKMAEIVRETDKLVAERETMLRERSAKRSFEKRVQESTKSLTGKNAINTKWPSAIHMTIYIPHI